MPVTPESVDLGYILKQIPESDFTMDDFDGRLRLQKTVYLLQAFGLYLGYDFHWYLRGPYCTKLAKTGFELEAIYGRIADTPVRFNRRSAQQKFEKAHKFLGDLGRMDLKANITDRLEIAASLHSVLDRRAGVRDAVEAVANKQERFSGDDCKKILALMERFGLYDQVNEAP